MELSAATFLCLCSTSAWAFTGPALATPPRGSSGSSSVTRIASTASTSSSGAASVGEFFCTMPRGPPVLSEGIGAPLSETFAVVADENVVVVVVAVTVVVQGLG